jgi:hypothetical protein
MKWMLSKLHYARKARQRPVRSRLFRPRVEQLEFRQLLSSNVLTYHNDLGRTGQILDETSLTPGNVHVGSFAQSFTYMVQGQVYAQPLYVAGVPYPDGTTHDTVFVATEHDQVYAIDANDGSLIWQRSFLGAGITPFTTSDAFGCGQISPELGITATPVIDPIYANDGTLLGGNMYVVAQTKEVQETTTYHQKLHVLDITTGQDVLPEVEIQASIVNDYGRTVTFNPRYYKERAALTLSSGTLYTAWASHCDHVDSTSRSPGWVIGYDAASLKQVSVFNTAPNGTGSQTSGDLNTIWQGDGGLAVDSDGNLYLETGNGTGIDVTGRDYSEAVLKLDGGDGQTVDDYFIPFNYRALDQADRDLGSGAPMVLPDRAVNGLHAHLLVGAGKEGKIYLIDRDNMGGLNNPPTGPDLVVQSLPNAITGSWGTPAYFDAGDPDGPWIYYAGPNDSVKAFQLTGDTLHQTSLSAAHMAGNWGATPIVSANNKSDGIVWALSNASGGAILYAFDATNLAVELWDSNMVATDRLGTGVKFTSPIVADGKVFVPGSGYLTVFTLTGAAPSTSHPRLSARTIAQVAALVADKLSSARLQSATVRDVERSAAGASTTRPLDARIVPGDLILPDARATVVCRQPEGNSLVLASRVVKKPTPEPSIWDGEETCPS